MEKLQEYSNSGMTDFIYETYPGGMPESTTENYSNQSNPDDFVEESGTPPSEVNPVEENPGVEQTASPPYTPPEWIPVQFRPENDDYRGAYQKLVDFINSDEFSNSYLANLEKDVFPSESTMKEDYEKLRAFHNDPVGYVRAYMPELAEQTGIPANYTEEEMENILEKRMAETFGEDWRLLYDPAERLKFGSHSFKIDREYQKTMHDIEQQNIESENRRKEYIQQLSQKKKTENSPLPLTEENISRILEEEYKNFESAGIPREEYNQWIAAIRNGQEEVKPLSYYDIWKLKNFDKLIEKAKEEGTREGQRKVGNEMRRYAHVPSTTQSQNSQKNERKLTGDPLADRYILDEGRFF